MNAPRFHQGSDNHPCVMEVRDGGTDSPGRVPYQEPRFGVRMAVSASSDCFSLALVPEHLPPLI